MEKYNESVANMNGVGESAVNDADVATAEKVSGTSGTKVDRAAVGKLGVASVESAGVATRKTKGMIASEKVGVSAVDKGGVALGMSAMGKNVLDMESVDRIDLVKRNKEDTAAPTVEDRKEASTDNPGVATMDKVGVAILGLGRAGLYHLPNLAFHPDVCVKWVVDVASQRERVVQLCDQYGLKDTQFLDTDNCKQLFDDSSTTAVVIATPTGFHEAIIKRAVTAGKHVFCEKPISFTADVVRSCYNEANTFGRVLFCAFNRRFDRHHMHLKEKVQSGQLGSPRVIHYTARDPKTTRSFVHSYIRTSGGIFCDSAIHQLDYIMWLLGETPCSLFAVGGQTSDQAEVYEACGDVDATHITLHFPSGVHVHIEVLRETQPDFAYFRVEVVGTTDTYFMHKVTQTKLTTLAMDGSGKETLSNMDFSHSYKREMDCFIRVVQGREQCPVLADEVIMASQLADLCQVSLREKKVISL